MIVPAKRTANTILVKQSTGKLYDTHRKHRYETSLLESGALPHDIHAKIQITSTKYPSKSIGIIFEVFLL